MIQRPSLVLRVGVRQGLSLLEVLVALAIFLMALGAIGLLVTQGANRALEVQQQGQATQLCQAKLAEVVAGAVPLTSQSDVPFDEEPQWLWSLDAEQGSVTGLWNVTVRVARRRTDGSRLVCNLNQMVLDPSLRGSTFDTPPPASDTPDSSAGSTAAASSPDGASGSSAPPAAGAAPKAATGSTPTTGATPKAATPSTPPPASGAPASKAPASATPSSASPAIKTPSAPPAPPATPPPPASPPPKSGTNKGGK